jgi:tRNA threonylcarbamoyl adenosine modification protein YeaZ/ribosomal-protein-alanine acetyltransferase
MVVLALETATRAGSVALLVDGVMHSHAGPTSPTHGERLPGELISILAEQGLTVADVDRLAVISGPGSFTGLRVGMAALQGMALVTGKHVTPVPTLDAMAESWRLARASAGPAVLVACLDGQRDEVFFGAWEMRHAQPIELSRQIVETRVGRPAELAQELAALDTDAPIVIVGDGASRYGAEFSAARPNITIGDVPAPLAEPAARIAARRPELAVAPHALRPLYVRRPDAELARARMHAEDAITLGRASESDDLSEVELLQRRAFTNAWGPEALRWELTHTDVARLYVMRSRRAGPIIAYCACWLVVDELHINSLAVDDAWRRKGLARRLLRHVFEDAVGAGATSATLEVRQSNRAGRALYEGLGFRVEGVRRDYYQEPREDALLLWNRRLAEH